MEDFKVDITPTPRILRTLGDIPFATWQCLAELVDNSIDAFNDLEKKGRGIVSPRIDVYWSSENVPGKQREIVIEDNGIGMRLEVLQKAAKAGYSSNDPIHNLGLFGMGFNIATARLGNETTFISATPESEDWVGIKINFDQLIKAQSFSAPIVRIAKKSRDESGTKVIVTDLREGIFNEIKRKESQIRKQLESIYTTTLAKGKIQLLIQGKQLSPRPHCVWSESRYVVRKNNRIYAIQSIDRDLGETYFDSFRNRYLSEDEIADLDIKVTRGHELPDYIVKRSRRLKGWLGIQRFSDPHDFGIDFIRNGRKILIRDKSLFGYENPDTGTISQEYPVELGSTVGGRIVGELHVDYLIPTYQKNGFDTTDRAWRLTLEAIRGAGPILPKQRQIFGYDGDNESPLGKLINAYRRPDPGTKNLAIANSLAKRFHQKFLEKDLEYESDEKWYRAAQEADRERGEGGKNTTPINSGELPSDDVGSYIDEPLISNEIGQKPPLPTTIPVQVINSTRDHLIQISDKETSLSGSYRYGIAPGLDLTSWRITEGVIRQDGKRMPYLLFQDGVEVDFFYDPFHPVIMEYPISAKQLLLFALAEKFALRDRPLTMQNAFIGLIDNHLSEERINYQSLLERADSIISGIRDQLPSILGHRFTKVKEVIQEVESEEEDLARRLLEEAPHLLEAYQESSENAIQCLAYIGDSLVKRLISRFPEEFMDNKVFKILYYNIKIGNESMRDRLRRNSLEQLLLYFSDLLLLLQSNKIQSQTKQELLRYSHTLSLLEELLVDRN